MSILCGPGPVRVVGERAAGRMGGQILARPVQPVQPARGVRARPGGRALR
ncbi:hypothetical protein ACFCZ1_07325 [Streptomyces sp. NPDC056224]